MTQFDPLIANAQAFLHDLNANNTRDWWQAHKAIYDDQLKTPALALMDAVCAPLQKLTGVPVVPKLFRPHRDVRFSKDKTPYTTHLHLMWQVAAEAPQNPVFFFGIGLDYVTTGAGMMGFDKLVLSNWRKMVDLDTDRITGIIAGVEAQEFSLREPTLKRVPSPYGADHAAARLLRMKGVVASRQLSGKGPLPKLLEDSFTSLWPLNDLLSSIAEA
jgi:uncharacterized protein (TIGR02453 family)